MDQIIQVLGAMLILLGFVLAQRGVWTTDALPYLWVNLVGAAILAWVALTDHQWGFLLLEGVWTLVSGWSIVARLRGANAAPNAD